MDWDKYNREAQQYFQPEISDFVRFIIHELDVDYHARILELGSGAGWIAREIARRLPDATVIGLEQNPDLLELARQNKQAERLTQVDFAHWDADSLHIFSARSFDVIISWRAFHRWQTPVTVLNAIERIIKNQGKFVISDCRNDLKFIARAAIWLGALNMSNNFRHTWEEMFDRSYAVSDALKIFLQSRLKDWKLRTTALDFLIFKD